MTTMPTTPVTTHRRRARGTGCVSPRTIKAGIVYDAIVHDNGKHKLLKVCATYEEAAAVLDAHLKNRARSATFAQPVVERPPTQLDLSPRLYPRDEGDVTVLDYMGVSICPSWSASTWPGSP